MSSLGSDNSTRIRIFCIGYYNLKELAEIYCVSKYIMRERMKRYKSKIGEPDGYEYDPVQVALVFRLIPLPSNVRIVKA